ncbi:hypothetical protein D9M70_647510 [compost metagenome]
MLGLRGRRHRRNTLHLNAAIKVVDRGRDDSIATGDGAPICCHCVGSRSDRIVFCVDVTHELSHRLVRGQRHADLDWRSRVGDVGGSAVANAMCADMRDASTL